MITRPASFSPHPHSFAVALVALLASHVAIGATSEPVHLTVSALARSSDILPISQIEPHASSTPGAVAEISVPLGNSSWSAFGGATVGGSWQTFVGPGFKGRISYVEWTMRTGIERPLVRGPRSQVEVALFYEYGEVNSWLENLILKREGPRDIHTGGGVRLSGVGPRRWGLRPVLRLERSVYRAQATDDTSRDQYAWIGGSTAVSFGLRFEMRRRAEE